MNVILKNILKVMNYKILKISLLFFLLISSKGIGQKVRIEIKPNKIGINESLSITIIIENESLKNYSNFPDIAGFNKAGRTSSSSSNYINGKMTSSQSIIQNYKPNKIGIVKIPSFSMQINNQTVVSKEKDIEIVEQTTNQKNDPFNNFFDPFDSFFNRNRNIEFIDIEADAFLSLNTDKKKVFVGEGFNTTLSLFVSENNRADMRFFDLGKQLTEIIKKIKPENCWEENYNIENINSTLVSINNKRYNEYKIFEATYFPLNKGSIIFPELDLDLIQYQIAKNPTFFGQNKKEKIKKFISKPISVSVVDLPDHPLKESVVVGKFQLKETIDSINLTTEKSFDYDFEIIGNGNINAISEPKINIENFDFYPPNILQNINRNNKKIYGSKKFKYYVIPKEPGKYDFSSINWIYFDPYEKKYDTLKSQIILNVSGSSTKDKEIESNEYDSYYKNKIFEEDNTLKSKKNDHYQLFLNFTVIILLVIITILIIKKYNNE